MPARKSAETVITNLRLKESLRAALEHEAKKNDVSLSREMVKRLEQSLESGAKIDLNAIRDELGSIQNDMQLTWLRYAQRFLALELEQEIIPALMRRDFETAYTCAIALKKKQAAAARWETARGFAPDVKVASKEDGE